jgi:hypothetical protein
LCVIILSIGNGVVFADVWEDLNPYDYKYNEDIEDFVWKEGDSTLPEYPNDSDLLEVDGPPNYSRYHYFIDGKTLTTDATGVVRFGLIILSPSGSDNAFYDGIRCTENQIKHYAYGSTDMKGNKKFIGRTNAQWGTFRGKGVNAYAYIFATNYFCDHSGVMLKRHEIIQNIKYGKGTVDGLYY